MDGVGESGMSYYAEKLAQGIEYQDFVMEKLYEQGLPLISYGSKKYQVERGENKAGIEIKNDQKFRQTGNFYIETAEKSNACNENYIASGIYRKDNTWLYLIGDYQEIYVFSKYQLKLLHKQQKYKEVETPTSQGYLLPVESAKSGWCIKIIDCGEVKKE